MTVYRNLEVIRTKRMFGIPKSRFGTAERKNLMKHLKPNDLESVWWKGELIYPLICYGTIFCLNYFTWRYDIASFKPKTKKVENLFGRSFETWLHVFAEKPTKMNVNWRWMGFVFFLKHKWCGKKLYGHTINVEAEMRRENGSVKKKNV